MALDEIALDKMMYQESHLYQQKEKLSCRKKSTIGQEKVKWQKSTDIERVDDFRISKPLCEKLTKAINS